LVLIRNSFSRGITCYLPGLSIQFPDGKSLNKTLPVNTEQCGCIGADCVGAVEAVTVIVPVAFTAPHPPEWNSYS
jgi:hypothetical protein